MNLSEIEKYKGAIMAIAHLNKAENLRIFGSVARGEDTKDSDLDLLVKFKQGASYFDLARLNSQLEELLKCKVDVVSEDSIKEAYSEYIYKDAKDL